jgi:hypothetical protein
MSCGASVNPLKRPVSCCGNRPFGMMMYSHTVNPMVPAVIMPTRKRWRSTKRSARA